MSPWDLAVCAQALADALDPPSHDPSDAQIRRGIDQLDELDLHPILAHALAKMGHGTLRERPYPDPAIVRTRSGRERCDLVLTPRAGQRLVDPMERRVERDAAEGTLFAEATRRAIDRGEADAIEPAEALWLEVKVVGQHSWVRGVPTANRAWGSQLVGAIVTDAAKLAADPQILHAGVALVLFTQDRETADHDLALALHQAIESDLPVGSPAVARRAIPDLIGNACATVAIVPVRGGWRA